MRVVKICISFHSECRLARVGPVVLVEVENRG
jgi:hypothetical protein